MKKKLNGLIIFTLIMTIFISSTVIAEEVRSVETNGSIGFTGVYEPIGIPDPPPSGSIDKPPIIQIAKPDGLLPQTNEIGHSWLIWLGVLLISFVFILWKRQRKQNKTIKQ